MAPPPSSSTSSYSCRRSLWRYIRSATGSKTRDIYSISNKHPPYVASRRLYDTKTTTGFPVVTSLIAANHLSADPIRQPWNQYHRIQQQSQPQRRWLTNKTSSHDDEDSPIYQETRFFFQLTEQANSTPLGSFMDKVVESSSRASLEHWVGWWMTRHAMKDFVMSSSQQTYTHAQPHRHEQRQHILPDWFLTQTFCILHRLVEELEFYHSEITELLQYQNDDKELLTLYVSGVNQLTHVFRAVLYPWLDAWNESHASYPDDPTSYNHHRDTVLQDDLVQVWNTLFQYETVIHKIVKTVTTQHSPSPTSKNYGNGQWSYWPIHASAFDTLLDMIVSTMEPRCNSDGNNHVDNDSHAQRHHLLELVDAIANFLMERQRRLATSQKSENGQHSIMNDNQQQLQQDAELFGPTWFTFHTAIQAWITATTTTTTPLTGNTPSFSHVHSTPQNLAAMNRVESLLQQMLEVLVHDRTWNQGHDTRYYANDSDDSAKTAAIEKAEQILKTFNLILMAWAQWPGGMLPNTTLSTTWVSGSTARVVDRVEALMQQLILMGSSDVNEHLQPNATTYLAILLAWANNDSEYHAANQAYANAPRDGSISVDGEQSREINAQSDPSWQHALFWLKHQERQQQEHQSSSSSPTPVLNRLDYQVLIATYAAQGKVEESEHLLKYMTDLFVRYHDMRYCPTVRCYNTVINAWANRRHEQAGIRAQELLKHLQELSTLLQGEEARNDIVTTKHQDYKDDHDAWNETWKPDVITFNSVLKAWVESGHVQAAQNCEALLQQLLSQEQGKDSVQDVVKPDAITFTIVMDAWARHAQRLSAHPLQAFRAAERAEHWLRYLEERHETEKGDNSYADDRGDTEQTIIYNAVIKAWSAGQSPERAQALLEELEERGQPDRQSYGTVIHAWGRSVNGANQAQTTFDKLLCRSRNDRELTPGVIEYNSLINAWAKAGNPTMAERLLRQMIDSQVPPDTISYTSVIQAWSHSGAPEAPERAQALLDDMERRYHDQKQKQPNDGTAFGGLCPDVHLYATIISLWAKSRCPEQAQALYDKLISRTNQDTQSDANRHFRPDLVLFNSLLDAWAKVGNGPRAEELLRNHIDKLLNGQIGNGHAEFKPDTVSFNTVLAAWSRSKDVDAASRADAVLQLMQHLHHTRQLTCPPDLLTFKATMRAWSKSQHPEAFHHILRLFGDVRKGASSTDGSQQQQRPIQMDVETYVICLQAIDRSQHLSDREKAHYAEQLVYEMKNDGVRPTPQVWSIVKSCGQNRQRRPPPQQNRRDSVDPVSASAPTTVAASRSK